MVATRAGVRRVDDDGLALWGFGDRAIDVLFDGRRVWSFWLERDTSTSARERVSNVGLIRFDLSRLIGAPDRPTISIRVSAVPKARSRS